MTPVLFDRATITELDPKGILTLTDGFADQCRRAEQIGLNCDLPALVSKPRLVVLTGLGGSAAGGDFVKCLFEAEGSIPFLVNRDYALPSYVGADDLVICASYSGNTEETLSAFRNAERVGAKILVISSGGELTDLAKKAGHTVISVPGGQPPRTAMGWMTVPVIVACIRLGLLPAIDLAEVWENLDKGRAAWTAEVPYDDNPAKQVAERCIRRIPVIYGLGGPQAVVAHRIRCQIHENSKAMAHANAFPELNHNEILGWSSEGNWPVHEVGDWYGILLSFGDETRKMQVRAEKTFELIGGVCPFYRFVAVGESLLSRMLVTASFGDYVSVYLARLRGVDPEAIGMIDQLKNELAAVPN